MTAFRTANEQSVLRVPRWRNSSRSQFAAIVATLSLVLAGCASTDSDDPSTESPPVAEVTQVAEVVRGSMSIVTPLPELTSLQNVTAEPEVEGVQWATTKSPALVIVAAADAAEGTYPVTLSGMGCVGSQCDTPFSVDMELVVTPIEVPASHPVQEFSEPSPDRIAAATEVLDGTIELADEVVVVLGTPESPGARADADTVAATVGAVVAGGMEDIGIYQLRWDTGQAIDDVVAALAVLDGVAGVDRSLVFDAAGSSAVLPEGDWDDDGQDSLWPYEQLHLSEAWALTETNGSTVPVGIVDASPVDATHPDLTVKEVTVPSSLGELALDPHSTHVAGLACAKQNGDGIVGAAWGCPIISDAVVNSWTYLDQLGDVGSRGVAMVSGLGAARRVIEKGAKVVNMSIGIAYPSCGSDSRVTALAELFQTDGGQMGGVFSSFHRLAESDIGRDILFTVAAGNSCIPGVSSPYAAAAAGLDNVISVSAVNSDGRLASFSDWGGEVAAGGGVAVPPILDRNGTTVSGEDGVWSTTPQGGYDTMYGTSQAAPLVAGVAALIREYHPDKTAAEVGKCITQNTRGMTPAGVSPYPTAAVPAVSQTYPGGTPIVDAAAAVRCLDLLNAPVPSLCEHPAGTLVAGTLPDIAEHDGRVAIRTETIGAIPPNLVAYGSLTDQPIAAALAVACSRGGTPWPEAVILYGKDTNYLGHVNLGDLAYGRQAVNNLTITDGVVRVDFTDTEGEGDAACCGRLDGTVDISLTGGEIQTNNLRFVDERPTAERALAAAVAGDDETLGGLTTEEAYASLKNLVEPDTEFTIGSCRGGGIPYGARCVIEEDGTPILLMVLQRVGFQQWLVTGLES